MIYLKHFVYRLSVFFPIVFFPASRKTGIWPSSLFLMCYKYFVHYCIFFYKIFSAYLDSELLIHWICILDMRILWNTLIMKFLCTTHIFSLRCIPKKGIYLVKRGVVNIYVAVSNIWAFLFYFIVTL